jgi:hypothetical protein
MRYFLPKAEFGFGCRMSMQYLVPCVCGERLSVTRSQAGQELICSCGKTVQVPKLREMASLEVAAAPVPARGTRGNRPKWGMARGILAAFGLAFALGCFANGLYYLYWRAQIDTSITMDVELAEGEKMIEQLKPMQLWELYNDFQETGLAARDVPPFVIAREAANSMESNALWSGGLGLAGLALTVAIAFFPSLSKKT